MYALRVTKIYPMNKSNNPLVFTKTRVTGIKPPAQGRAYYNDKELPALKLQVTAQGTKTWFVRVRPPSGNPIRVTLGHYPAMTPEQARLQAKDAIAAIIGNGNPNNEREAEAAAAATTTRESATVEQVLALYHQTYQLRPSTLQSYTSALSTVLGAKYQEPLLTITQQDVLALHRGYHSKSRANQAMRVLGRLYNFQLDRCNIKSRENPISRALSKNGEHNLWWEIEPRKSFITDEQLPAWFDAVEALPTAGDRSTWTGETARDLFLFQLMTGLRSIDECASLKWKQRGTAKAI